VNLQLLEWRSQVLELIPQDLNQSEISKKLKVHHSVISRDLKHVRNESRLKLPEHLDNRTPVEYQICMTGA
jgi:IS30 family transposase